ncbi:hypothetical protein BDV38DRAFT_12112 [Aspergillus pseudotamarii]|uniref:Uncharacterized protein n=1 Tax=Aspergillus pseudotamarii TaxID=132259 RepID=A0A5N6SAL7_ASPPS|nr:uncharacterized protein BDV38DRAFT_12112 [Aspergillus pseudotamarii]KAE8131752.1 hypothetical protein BDV38DRAFT_12112 [Aspergillus pseudotamarii]
MYIGSSQAWRLIKSHESRIDVTMTNRGGYFTVQREASEGLGRVKSNVKRVERSTVASEWGMKVKNVRSEEIQKSEKEREMNDRKMVDGKEKREEEKKKRRGERERGRERERERERGREPNGWRTDVGWFEDGQEMGDTQTSLVWMGER